MKFDFWHSSCSVEGLIHVWVSAKRGVCNERVVDRDDPVAAFCTCDLNNSLARCVCLSASSFQWTLSSINPASQSLSDSSWKQTLERND